MKRSFVAIIVTCCVLAGGIAAFAATGTPADEETTSSEEGKNPATDTSSASNEQGDKPPSPEGKEGAQPGDDNTAQFGTFVVNLADQGGQRFLQIEVWVEVTDPKSLTAVVDHIPRTRHAIIGYLGGLRAEATYGPLAKDEMSAVIKRLINNAIGRDVVDRVYFSQFIVN